MIKIISTCFVSITLVACSGPDSSGGVALSKDPSPTNAEFPHGDCFENKDPYATDLAFTTIHGSQGVTNKIYESYVNLYTDLTKHYETYWIKDAPAGMSQNNTGISKPEFGVMHWVNNGRKEGRSLTGPHDGGGFGGGSGVETDPAVATVAKTNTGCGWIRGYDKSYYIKPGADLRGASLEGADLRDAELEGAILDSAYMPHVNLRYADLRGASLEGATLSHANLRYASLREAKLRGAILWGVDGLRAKLWSADLTAASLRNAKMGAAQFSLATLSGADLRGAWFSGDDIVTPTPTDYFRDVKANSSTICPDGTRWGTAGNDCPF